MYTSETSYFTDDLGQFGSDPPRFYSGPLVLTYIEPGAEIEVRAGHPAHADEDSPPILRLRGESFRGSFFVCPGWTISATTPSAVISGYDPKPHLGRMENKRHHLLGGGELIYRPLGQSMIRISDGADLADRKLSAICEARTLLGYDLHPMGDWSEDSSDPNRKNRLALYFWISAEGAGLRRSIERRIAVLRRDNLDGDSSHLDELEAHHR
jgi:hypothetical protein